MSVDESKGLGVFENLSLIPSLLEEIKSLNLRVMNLEKELIPKLDLTKRADVLKYLEVSNSTLECMMKDGRFKRGVHFTKELKGNRTRINFISSAIMNWKERK